MRLRIFVSTVTLLAAGMLLLLAVTSPDTSVITQPLEELRDERSPQTSSANVSATNRQSAAFATQSVSTRAHGRGTPRISYSDGVELAAPDQRNLSEQAAVAAAGAGSTVLTSGDFDSDGIADLVTADGSGTLKLYRGTPDTIYPNSVAADARRAAGMFSDAPFDPAVAVKHVSIAPDFFAAGDFNADGHADVLAARRGESVLHLLAGDGAGNFADDRQIQVDGSITALATGEIGRADGQADVAVALIGPGGASIAVFEHPKGAFKHGPEIISLPAQTDVLAIGHLDTDYFGDIATAGGNRLTIVRGRGQAFPWDMMEGYDIQRPAAVVETRTLSSDIAALATGQFTGSRGESLAILTTDGALRTLKSPPAENKAATLNAEHLEAGGSALPAKAGVRSLAKFRSFSETVPSTSDSAVQEKLFTVENGSVVPVNAGALPSAKPQQLSAEQKAALTSGDTNLDPESRERAKAGFLRSIAPGAAAPLEQWTLQAMASDARLSRSASSITPAKLVKVRASDSGRDELAFVDPSSNQIHLMSAGNHARVAETTSPQIVSFDVASAPAAVLPMRLNADAISDLVVLREGSVSPTIVMSAPANTFVVTTSSDEDDGSCGASCSLREAINAANDAPGADLITFNTGPTIIQPESPLPEIEFAVTIDASTGPGNQPFVEIKGNVAGAGANGLSINAADVVVRGLIINEFQTLEGDEGNTGGSGIAIYNYSFESHAGSCIIENNYLGTDRTGFSRRGNEQAGLLIFDSNKNVVGGANAAARNVISGNGNGDSPQGDRFAPGILIIDGDMTVVQGNYVGVAVNGSSRLSNSAGIVLSGANNEIGGDAAGAGNVVSGNAHSAPTNFDPQGCYGGGIAEESVIKEDTGEWVTQNSNFRGNRIGVNAAGNAAVGNCRTGLSTSPRNTATIGSITEGGRNTISGNTDGGLFCTTGPRGAGFGFSRASELNETEIPEGSCKITGNNVGTDVTGSFAIPNNHSRGDQIVRFFGALVVETTATFSTVGGHPGTSPSSCTGHCNLVSGNNDTGITRHLSEGDVGIWNNYIGTNKNGTAAVPNEGGVFITSNASLGGFFTSNGSDISLGNLISGNRRSALNVTTLGSAQMIVFIRGNLIGTDVSGVSAIPNNSAANAADGQTVALFGTPIVIIGGPHPGERNVIAGNFGSGIVFGSGVLSAATVNNYIGVNKNGQPLGNGMDGVELRGSFEYFGDNGIGNVIANNGRNGVYVSGPNGVGNRLRFNSIYNNGALGIELTADTTIPREPDGVTPNDCLDEDSGPNELQNYPVLTSPFFNQNGTVTVGGALSSKASQTYTLDFYSNSSADPSNYGEGETYIGSKTVTTDGSGKTAFQFTSEVAVGAGLKITATATDTNGSTSEFSCVAGLCDVRAGAPNELAAAMDAASAGCAISFIVNINSDQADPNPADGICDVDLNTTGEQCTLRAAIQTTNALAGTDFISFNIPGGGVQTISPTSELPAITEKVFINGTTQAGYAGKPLVEIQGSAAGALTRGLIFASGSDGSQLSGLTINRFRDAGVEFASNDNVIERCYIGLGADGQTTYDSPRQPTGILISGARNRVGGAKSSGGAVANNYITGNGLHQIEITSAAATENEVIGNEIGGLVDGAVGPGGLSARGIFITAGASGNKIGGDSLVEEANSITGLYAGLEINKSARDNIVTGNFFEFSRFGVVILNSSGNRIGGEFVDIEEQVEGNIFDRNEIGISVDADATGATRPSANNQIFGNLFLVDKRENVPNDISSGIVVGDAADTLIGNGQTAFQNTILDQTNAGIVIGKEAVRTVINRNQIGISGDGSARPNVEGIRLAGSGTQVTNNVVSGNSQIGIAINRLQDADPLPSGNTISNNRIGTANAGTVAVPNENGITVEGNQNSITANVISGNSVVGATVFGNQNTISQNMVGTDPGGNSAVGGQALGLRIEGSANTIAANTVSGHSMTGIVVAHADQALPKPTGNIIRGNRVGTNSAGTAAIPNLGDGIVVAGANNTLIGGFGGDMPAARNIVSGNGRHGILLAAGALQNRVSGNYIGTASDGSSALGNAGNGIFLQQGVGSTKIGGLENNAGNTIAYNGSNGILLAADAGNNNIIDPNRIFANGGLGIDLRGDGRTPNDPGDADEGPNRLQNYPEIIASRVNASNQLVVAYRVPSAPANANYGAEGLYLEFFIADAGSEGARFLGSDHYTITDYNSGSPGAKEVNLGEIGALGFTPGSDKVTATATDADGNTSEFLPVVEIQFSSPTYTSSGNSGTITVTRSAATGTAAVDFATVEGGTATSGATCTAGVDYITTSGTLTFAAGESEKTFTVQVCAPANGADNGDTIHLALSNPQGGSLGLPSTAVLTIKVAPPSPPTAFSAGGPPPDVATVGHPYAGYTFVADGNPPPTYTIQADALPDGFSLSETGELTAANPTTAGTFSGIVVRASNASGFIDTAPFTITVNPAITFTTTTLPEWTEDEPGYDQTIVVTGGTGAKTLAITSGSLPPGLTLDSNSGAITGTPTEADTFTFTITAVDSLGAKTDHSYTITIKSSANGSPTPSPSPTASPSPSPTAAPKKLLNISTRLNVQTGENVLIGGVIVTGNEPKRVIIRAIGPSLSEVFDGALPDTTLELYQGDTLLADNDNWKDSQQADIEATTIPPGNDLESAIVQTLAPGFYTAVMSGKDGATGIGVVEVYDLDEAADSKLGNIASRGFVEAGDNVMIGGLIVGNTGTEDARVLVRAIGPSLGEAGVADALQDPTLELRDANGELLRENDDWQETQQAEIEATTIPPSEPAESAILVKLPSGNYTAIVRGKNDSTGVGLVEVYNVP